jgi:hypothetical protein
VVFLGISLVILSFSFNILCRYDDKGNRIEAHGGGFLTVGKHFLHAHASPILFFSKGNVYYWYGESKKTSSLSDHGVNCYSSTDLVFTNPFRIILIFNCLFYFILFFVQLNWHFERQVLYQQNITGVSQAGPYVVPLFFFFSTLLFLSSLFYPFRHSFQLIGVC